MVWLKQKSWITNGVPLSTKFVPNLIFIMEHAFRSFLIVDLRGSFRILRLIFCITLAEELNTYDAKVKTRMLTIMVFCTIRGTTRKPGMGISLCICMQTYWERIWSDGASVMREGTSTGFSHSLRCFSNTCIPRYFWITWFTSSRLTEARIWLKLG